MHPVLLVLVRCASARAMWLAVAAFFVCAFFARPAAAGGPTRVHVGIYVKALRLESKDEKATFDFYYWLRFQKPIAPLTIEQLKAIEIVNGDSDVHETYEERDIGDEHYVVGRIKGRFAFVARYEPYPFDRQEPQIQIEHKVLTADQVVLVPDEISYTRSGAKLDRLGVADELRAGDVRVVKAGFVMSEPTYRTDFGDLANPPSSSYSRLTYKVSVERAPLPYVLKFFTPLVIIISLAYLVFFIPAASLELACSLTVTSILAAIAFQITLANDLPNVGYLMCVDKIFYLAYMLIMVAMVQTVWTYHLDREGRKGLSDALETGGRWLFPVMFLGGSCWLMYTAAHGS